MHHTQGERGTKGLTVLRTPQSLGVVKALVFVPIEVRVYGHVHRSGSQDPNYELSGTQNPCGRERSICELTALSEHLCPLAGCVGLGKRCQEQRGRDLGPIAREEIACRLHEIRIWKRAGSIEEVFEAVSL